MPKSFIVFLILGGLITFLFSSGIPPFFTPVSSWTQQADPIPAANLVGQHELNGLAINDTTILMLPGKESNKAFYLHVDGPTITGSVEVASLPNPLFRGWHGDQVRLGDSIYIFGMMEKHNGDPTGTTYVQSRILIYDILTENFVWGDSIPVEHRVSALTLALHNDTIFGATGQFGSHTGAHDTLGFKYVPGTGFTTLPNAIPVGEERDHAESINIGNKWYLFGGRRSNFGFLPLTPATLVFDFPTYQWTVLADMPDASAGARAIEVNGDIMVVGGEYYNAASDSVYKTTRFFDPATNSWTIGFDLNYGRHAFILTEINGLVYTIAGSVLRGGSPIAIPDPTDSYFTEMLDCTAGNPLPVNWIGSLEVNIYRDKAALHWAVDQSAIQTFEVRHLVDQVWQLESSVPANPLDGIYQYRSNVLNNGLYQVWAISYDGNISYSSKVEVTLNTEATPFNVFPNPISHEDARIFFKGAKTVEVFDTQMRLLSKKIQNGDQLDLPAGTYFVQPNSGKGSYIIVR